MDNIDDKLNNRDYKDRVDNQEEEKNNKEYDEDKIRVPAWTDRIFYCKNKNIKMLTYDTIKSIRYSDHRPVVGTFLVNCVNKKNENNGRIYNDNNNNNFNNNRNNFIYAEKQNIKEIKNVNYNNNINRDNANNKKNNNIQNKKINNEKIKMNYRGIDFNTEIEINKDNFNRNYSQNREKQNIYDFFQDKRNKKKKERKKKLLIETLEDIEKKIGNVI